MTIPERHNPPEGPSSCPDTSANPISHNPTLGNSWHTSFDPPFNDECDDLNNLHKKEGYSPDLVIDGDESPPSNIHYTIIHNDHIDDPKLEETFSIDIHWKEPSSSVQGIEIFRTDNPKLIFIQDAPAPTTTTGWFISDGNPENPQNPITTNLQWGSSYTFALRTNYQFVGSGSIFSEWVYLDVFERNDVLRRKNDKCAIETLESLEVRLSQNFAEIPKAYRYSKIVRGGSRQVVCKTWRPQGWNDGKFLREDYPITVAVEAKAAQKAAENAGKALCGGEPCIPGDTGTESTKISSYTGNLIFGTAAINFREGVNNQESLQVYPCGKAMRRTGGKLPIN